MSKAVLVPLAEGFEEIEALTIVDILRRGGLNVTTASLKEQQVTGAHNVTVTADTTLDNALTQSFDAIVLPGGLPGAFHLRDDDRIINLLQEFAKAGKITSAICAAPVALAKAGLLNGKKATSYPTCLDGVEGVSLQSDKVVKDGTVITSRGPATAMAFALALVGELVNAEKQEELSNGLLFNQ